MEASGLLHVLLRRERRWCRRELRIDGVRETLGGHGEVLLGGHGGFVHGRAHLSHEGLQVVLGFESQVALPGEVLEVRGASLMWHVIPGARLARPLEVSRAIKPRGALEACGPLLEAHGGGSRAGTHVV